MYAEYCIDVPNSKFIGDPTEGTALNLEVLSFLGDVDRRTGTIVSEDTKARGYQVKDRILIVRKFRGSTVGVYVLYSLCKNGLAPKAIICGEPDPVIVAGIVLCSITGVFKVPETIMEQIKNGDRIRIEPLKNGTRICIAKS